MSKEIERNVLKLDLLLTNKGQLKGLPKNPRLIKDERFKKLVESIKQSPEFLNIRELVVYPFGGKYIVIAGNQRLSAIKELGWKEVVCKILPIETTIEKLKEYTIKDNVSFGETDWDIVNEEWNIKELENWGEEENKELIKKEKKEKNKSNLELRIDNTISDIEDGDIFELGSHILMCGDSTNTDNIKNIVKGKNIELILTDPPYEIEFPYNTLEFIDNSHVFIFNNDRAVINQLKKSTLDFKKFFIFNHPGCAIPQEGGNEVFLDHVLITHEVKGKPYVRYNKGNGTRSVIKGEYRKSEAHKHEKPFEVLSPIIEGYSNEGDFVLDLFGGSGSLLRACEKLDRRGVCIELSPIYCKIIIEELLKQNNSLNVIRNGIDETEKWIKEIDNE